MTIGARPRLRGVAFRRTYELREVSPGLRLFWSSCSGMGKRTRPAADARPQCARAGRPRPCNPVNLQLAAEPLRKMSDLPQSDVSRPSKLPTANLLLQGAAPPAIEQTSAEYLEAVEEEWNKRVDVEIETLADGMVDLVNLASVRSHGVHSQSSLT